MKYVIDYAICCNTGRLRRKNQDNFFCQGLFLPYENNGLEKISSGTVYSSDIPVFGVFDGMGGEQLGEYAAFIAATTLKEKSADRREGADFLTECCYDINRDICDFAVKNGVRSMGSTGCLISFGKKEVSLCNIGDSKIFHLSGDVLSQLSVDHCLEVVAGKAPLTQFLGVFEREFIIQPHNTSVQYTKSDRFLICSDGLTDMVDLGEIKTVLSSGQKAAKCCEILLSKALEAGGRDNITVLICDIRKKSLF